MTASSTDLGDRKDTRRRFRLSFTESSLLVAALGILLIPVFVRVPSPDALVHVQGALGDFRSYQPVGKGAYLSIRLSDRPQWFALETGDLPLVKAVLAERSDLEFHADYANLHYGGIHTYGLVANGTVIRRWREELEGHRALVRWAPPAIALMLVGLVAIAVAARLGRDDRRGTG